jgi:hypothetical protein
LIDLTICVFTRTQADAYVAFCDASRNGDYHSGSQFRMITGIGHLPCIEEPRSYAKLQKDFMEKLS